MMMVGGGGEIGCSGAGGGGGAVCPVCGKAFHGRNRRQNLSHHLLTHTGTRPFPCPSCAYRATQKAHLKRHMERRHGHNIQEIPLVLTSSSNMLVGDAERMPSSEGSHLPPFLS